MNIDLRFTDIEIVTEYINEVKLFNAVFKRNNIQDAENDLFTEVFSDEKDNSNKNNVTLTTLY